MSKEQSISEVDSYVENIVQLFVRRKIVGACLLSSTMLAEVTNGNVVEGFLIFDELKVYFRHYWTIFNNRIYDIAHLVRQKLYPVDYIARLSEVEPPSTYKYLSMQNIPQLTELEKGYKQYTEKSRKYFKKAPGWSKKFLSKTKNYSNDKQLLLLKK